MFRLKSPLLAARYGDSLCQLDIPEGHWQFIATSDHNSGVELPYHPIKPRTYYSSRPGRQTYGFDDNVNWIVLDTCSRHEVGGSFCPDRRHWLSHALVQCRGPIILFMAYPPFSIDMNEYYIQGFDDEGGFSTLLMRSRDRIRGLVWHHGNHPVSGVWQGIPHFNLPYLLNKSVPLTDSMNQDNGIITMASP